jgi:hypothetical protein
MDRATILKVAAEAEADPRTVQSYVNGKAVRPSLQERIERAMKTLKVKR